MKGDHSPLVKDIIPDVREMTRTFLSNAKKSLILSMMVKASAPCGFHLKNNCLNELNHSQAADHLG